MDTLSFIEIGTDGEKAHRGRHLDVGDGLTKGRGDNRVSLVLAPVLQKVHEPFRFMESAAAPFVEVSWRVPRSARSRMKTTKSG